MLIVEAVPTQVMLFTVCTYRMYVHVRYPLSTRGNLVQGYSVVTRFLPPLRVDDYADDIFIGTP